MFESLFPSHWTTLKKLMWLKLKGAAAVWSTISGNPVSFTAKAAPLKQLSVAFSPVQDLHGYDAPWPAGGGKNKYVRLVDSIVTKNGLTITPTSDSSFYLKGTATETTVIDVWDESANIILSAGTYTVSATFPAGGALGWAKVCKSGTEAGIADWVRENNPVTFTLEEETSVWVRITISIGQTLDRDIRIQLEAGNSATAFAPYSNICPILGWDSLNVWQTGVNLWDETWERGVYNYTTGEKGADSASYVRSVGFIPCAPNTQYARTPNNIWVFFYDAEKNYVGYRSATGTFTTPTNCRYLTFNTAAGYGGTYNNDISINYPHTDTAYHAYNPSSRSISISFGSTVYSGYVDCISGEGVVTMIMQDMGDLGWSYQAGVQCFSVARVGGLSDFANGQGTNEGCLALCSQLKRLTDGRGSSFSNNDKCYSFNKKDTGSAINGNYNSGVLIVKDTDYTDAETFKTAMRGVQLCYELATPITIQLTPQEVESLAGDNVLFSDANGDLTVEYRSN